MATTLSDRKSDSEYSKKYDKKRNAARVPLNFYLDDEVEKEIYGLLSAEKNKKQAILAALKKYYGVNG